MPGLHAGVVPPPQTGAQDAVVQVDVLCDRTSQAARAHGLVEAADLLEHRSADGHVGTLAQRAACAHVELLGLRVGDDGYRAVGLLVVGHVDATGQEREAGILEEACRDGVGPVGRDARVVVDVCHEVVARVPPAGVAGDRRAGDVAADVRGAVALRDVPHRGVPRRGVDDDELVVGAQRRGHGGQAAVQQLGTITRRHDDRHR